MQSCSKFLQNIFPNIIYKNKIFAAAMSEALESQKDQETHNQSNRNIYKSRYKSRYNGQAKKRVWESDDKLDKTGGKEKRANFNPADRIKKKKTVILLGYSGVNYYGMQRNPGQKTIEEDLLLAMLKNKWIDQDGYNQAQHVQFQRAARTDKGVSASRQVCSIKLPEQLDVVALNRDLPEQIHVFATKRVTKGFNSKDQCNARTYSYTLPTIAFANYNNNVIFESYRTTQETIEQFNKILKIYEGTKNFHNFTSKKEYLDPSSKRFIMSFVCAEPFLSSNNIEFATIRIKGQSFMMHQIRKMIGLALAVLRGYTTMETINRALTEERIDIPMAPGLGLVLDQVHYERYNERYGSDGIHEPLIWNEYEEEIEKFTTKYINSTIFETEFKEKPMISWLETLGYHSYDVRQNTENIKNKNGPNGENDNERILNIDSRPNDDVNTQTESVEQQKS